ncbi:MAG TPA: response regulator transcription factor [Actinomycetes bacterium]
MTIRVLIADDQALVRAGFRMIIDAQEDMEVVAEAGDGVEAVDRSRHTLPRVVLMDIRMPAMDGIEATRRLTAPGSSAPRVVILTTYDLDEYVFDALAAGASGFLLKDVPPEDLVRAIRVAAEGEALLAPTVTRRLIEQFARGRPAAPDASRLEPLTDREVEVLRLLARGLSNAEIAGTLFLGESTVKTHVGHILDKLRLRDRVQAVIAAYEAGLVRPGQPDADQPSG